jgi:hypothetical protein
MLLLPELLYRHTCGRPLFQPAPVEPPAFTGGPPLLSATGPTWDTWARRGFERPAPPSRLERAWSRLRAKLAAPADAAASRDALVSELDWMAAKAYQPHWPGMRQFALPSFYDGRVRINLRGRERAGRVALADYAAAVKEVETLLHECVDPVSGESVVDFFEHPSSTDPLQVGPTESDLVVVWKGMPLGLQHPRLGNIGPVPFRRTGGHTGPHGIAYVAGNGIVAGERGIASAFDVVPTVLELLGEPRSPKMSGRSLLHSAA